MQQPLQLDVPLYNDLWRLEPRLADASGAEPGFGLASLGIGFTPPAELENGEYFCTPRNSVAFAWTGGDGEHFSFLVDSRGTVQPDSPVILTAPACGTNAVVSEGFEAFLRMGLRRGYFGLAQLAYDPDAALEVFSNPDWAPGSDDDWYVGYVPDDEVRRSLDFLAQSLELEPLDLQPTVFWERQERVLPMFDIPDLDDDDL